MPTGKVRFYDDEKGFGFNTTDDGQDVFLHATVLPAGTVVKAGTRQPLHPGDTADLLVLHRTRIDAEGRLALTRLDDALHPRWSTTLPIQKLGNRFEFPDRLLLYGGCPVTMEGATSTQDFVMSLQLSDGALQAWNVTREERFVPAASGRRTAP